MVVGDNALTYCEQLEQAIRASAVLDWVLATARDAAELAYMRETQEAALWDRAERQCGEALAAERRDSGTAEQRDCGTAESQDCGAAEQQDSGTAEQRDSWMAEHLQWSDLVEQGARDSSGMAVDTGDDTAVGTAGGTAADAAARTAGGQKRKRRGGRSAVVRKARW